MTSRVVDADLLGPPASWRCGSGETSLPCSPSMSSAASPDIVMRHEAPNAGIEISFELDEGVDGWEDAEEPW
jgi:hypothetical protein